MALAEHYYADGLGGIGAGADDVLDLLARARPAWMRDSLCSEYPAISWFEPADTAAAVAICARCTVAEECAAWARQNAVSAGVWAGVALDPPRRPQRPTGRVVSDGAPGRVREVGPVEITTPTPSPPRPPRAIPRPKPTPPRRVPKPKAVRARTAPSDDDQSARFQPASCARCPMAVKKGKTLCKGCERDSAPPS